MIYFHDLQKVLLLKKGGRLYERRFLKRKLSASFVKLNRYLAGQGTAAAGVSVPAGYTLAGLRAWMRNC